MCLSTYPEQASRTTLFCSCPRLRELNIFNTNISVIGLAGILQTMKGLLVLTRGVRLCQALAYQVCSCPMISRQPTPGPKLFEPYRNTDNNTVRVACGKYKIYPDNSFGRKDLFENWFALPEWLQQTLSNVGQALGVGWKNFAT